MQAATSFYSSLAIFVLLLHALFILWVVFGALLTRSRPILRWLHIASLVWGILTELLPWPCRIHQAAFGSIRLPGSPSHEKLLFGSRQNRPRQNVLARPL
ncbi:MAG: DUF2784 domain-containing protein [Acidobacteriia bacterium]|nr:DUF2784 domain-containing protein [Terriglobia bacterium]